jgi:hypothetical protein
MYGVNGKEPIAAWIPSLDTAGNGTTTLTDLVGSNDGTLTNMDAATDWVVDDAKTALDFDGVNDFVQSAFVATPPVSMSAWVYLRSTSVNQSIMQIAKISGEVATSQQNFRIMFLSPSRFACVVQNNTASALVDYSIALSGWHHVGAVFTRDGSTDTCTLYVDGINRGTDSGDGDAILPTATLLGIGSRVNGSKIIPMDGLGDDFRIWGQALTDEDFAALYAAGRGGILSAAVGFTGIRGAHNRIGTAASGGFTGIRGISRRLGT